MHRAPYSANEIKILFLSPHLIQAVLSQRDSSYEKSFCPDKSISADAVCRLPLFPLMNCVSPSSSVTLNQLDRSDKYVSVRPVRFLAFILPSQLTSLVVRFL